MIVGQSLAGIDPTFDYVVSLLAPKNMRLTSREYPDFEALKADYDATGSIYVNVNHSDATIFGEASTNWKFRAWHDMCHIKENADFTSYGEACAARLQCDQINALVGPTQADKYRWNCLIDAEVNGQGAYFVDHSDFPIDQRSFVRDYLFTRHNLDVATFPKNLDSISIQY